LSAVDLSLGVSLSLDDGLVVTVVLGSFLLLLVADARSFPLDRATTSAAGALTLVALGLLSPGRALASIDGSTLLLLFGMMVHVDALSRSEFYGWTAARLTSRARTPRRLVLGTLVLSAGLSTVALNDATVLLLTPVVLHALSDTDVDPVPALVAIVLGANVGSVATPLGNPQNAYVLSQGGVTAAAFVVHLAPVALVSLVVTGLLLSSTYPSGPELETSPPPDFDRRWAVVAGGFLFVTLALLLAFPTVNPGVLATGTAVVSVVWMRVFRGVGGADVLVDVNWGILVLFAGMFVLVGGLETTPLVADLAGLGGGWPLAGATFALSNAVSNVPAVVLLSSVVHGQQSWLVLAGVSTLAGNATPIASAATLIVLERAARRGVDVPVSRVVRIGFPVAVVTSALAVAMLGMGL